MASVQKRQKRLGFFLFFFIPPTSFFCVPLLGPLAAGEPQSSLGLLAWITGVVLCRASLYQPLSLCAHLSSGGLKRRRLRSPSAAFPSSQSQVVKEDKTAHFNGFFSLFLSGASGQRVKVEPEVSSYPGQSVTLRCAFADPTEVQLTMVRETK